VIPATGGKTVKVRFELRSDPGYEAGGWTIDDFCIVAFTPAPVEMPTSSGSAGGPTTSGGDNNVDDPKDVVVGCSCGTAPGSPFAWGGLAAFGLGVAARRARSRRRK
jgi:MYXO-CTERM domain-containing protein